VGLNDWDTLLSRAKFAHNAAVNETVRTAPFNLTYGYHPRTPVGEVVEVVHPASAAFVERLQSSLSFVSEFMQRMGNLQGILKWPSTHCLIVRFLQEFLWANSISNLYRRSSI
jgi:hypothetical protein